MQGWRWRKGRSKLRRMKRLILIALLALTACSGGDRFDGLPRLKPSANPSAVIAAELGFAALAQEKGQWTAFRQTATADAEMFVPGRVKAQDWLKGRADPAVAVKWQPYEVWSSCDGSYAVTRGAWQRTDSVGYFTTVWQRQKDGGYKWVLDMGDPLPAALPAPEMIAAKVADCQNGASAATQGAVIAATDQIARGNDDRKLDNSDDSTLYWQSIVSTEGNARLVVRTWDGKEYDTVIDTGVAPHAH